jgi:uncharacterized membrane protein YozB (DUF420 family)
MPVPETLMQALTALPTINAALNATSAVLLLTARGLIKRGQIQAHRRTMLAALTSSALFLACYLYYHAHVGSVHFTGQGWIRFTYFSILLTHTVLAAVIVPLILITLTRGLKRQDLRHSKIARLTFPLWMYVSVTGVVIYLMLYHL